MPVVDELAWLTDSDGNEVNLSTDGVTQFKQGVNGRFMPPLSHNIDRTPGRAGGWYRGTDVGLGLLSLPLLVVADDITTLRYRLKQLGSAVNPLKGPMTMTVAADSDATRSIRCIFESGIETDPATEGEEYQSLAILNFRALDSFWSDTEMIERPFSKQAETGSPFPLPMRVGPSSLFAQWTETNPGDATAEPITTVAGPGRNPLLVNDTTGEQVGVTFQISAGQSIVFDTPNGVITGPGGIDLSSVMTGDLWELAPGDNTIRLQLEEAETNDSELRFTYMPRYLGV